MIRIRRHLLAYVAILLFCSSLLAQSAEAVPQGPTQTTPPATAERSQQQRDAYRKAMEDADQKIAAEVRAHSELMKNLEYLTTQIGPRLTGSPQMQAASQWTLKRFQDYHVEAHLELSLIHILLLRPDTKRTHHQHLDHHNTQRSRKQPAWGDALAESAKDSIHRLTTSAVILPLRRQCLGEVPR